MRFVGGPALCDMQFLRSGDMKHFKESNALRDSGDHSFFMDNTEIVQSYILSLAVNFHPYEVGFLLIDYKGGGMANLFQKLRYFPPADKHDRAALSRQHPVF